MAQEAEGYKQRLIATAEGDASRFRQINAEYAKAPEVTRNRMYLETMQQVYSNTSKVMVDAKGQGNLLYLPLDKLMQAAGAVVPQQAVASEPQAAARAAQPVSGDIPPQLDKAIQVERSGSYSSPREREALRSRDREVR